MLGKILKDAVTYSHDSPYTPPGGQCTMHILQILEGKRPDIRKLLQSHMEELTKNTHQQMTGPPVMRIWINCK